MLKLIFGIVALAGAGLMTLVGGHSPALGATAAPPLHVAGNKLVDPTGIPVQLRGVNYSGPEYACIQGWGIFDGPSDQASIDAIKSWNANAVRVPLNEDCWLAINDSPASYSGTIYQHAITSYVNLLNQNGLYAILVLHFSAPGTEKATGQQPMPNLDHSPAFWSSVASAFKGNDAVILELFNEPHPDETQDTIAAWLCWRDGGTCPGLSFETAGTQTLVNAVRATGATNVIAVGGVHYSNALSQWLAFAPSDPLGNLVAAWHVYNFNPCNGLSCYDLMAGLVAAQVPVLATEIGNNACDAAWLNALMNWFDARQIGYLAWAWGTGSACSDVGLISAFDGTPTLYGEIYKSHLAAPPTPMDTTATLTSAANPSVFGQSVTFTARVAPVPPGTGTPTGAVTFLAGETRLGTTTLSGGAASFSTEGLAASSATMGHAITASYSGDASFRASISGVLTQTVNRASTTTSLTTSGPSSSVFGHPVTLTATVAALAPGAGTPAGSVTFLSGTSPLGTSDLTAAGHATTTTTGLAIGTLSLSAVYRGGPSFDGSVSQPLMHAVSCPASLSIPLAIVGEEGQLTAVGTIQGTETTTGSLCAVAYNLTVRGLPLGGGTFLADHPAPGVITISNGAFTVRGVTLPLTFAGTVNTNIGSATITYSFASGARSRTVTIRFTLGPAGQWIVTSTTVTSP
jgi:cellulase (glycosyl hydrolase family 5)/Big-like domain-containing protein